MDGSAARDWVAGVLRAVDGKDFARFCGFLAEDAMFVFGNAPAVTGAAAARAAVGGFFETIDALCHDVTDVWSSGETILCRGTVTYTRRDGTKLTVPFANVVRMRGPLALHYQIYVDASRL
jgi:ketosteroid isomerase-like protein